MHTWFFGFSLSFTPKGPFKGIILDIKFIKWMWTIILSIRPKKIRQKNNVFKDLDFDFEEYIDDEED